MHNHGLHMKMRAARKDRLAHMWAGCRVLALRDSAICIAPPATCARNFSVAIAAVCITRGHVLRRALSRAMQQADTSQPALLWARRQQQEGWDMIEVLAPEWPAGLVLKVT